MSQNPLKDKTNPSLNYISTYKLPMKTAREKEKVTNSNTKLPPLSIPLGINSHNHPIILAKPKFPNSLHLNSSYNKLNQNNAQKHEYEKEEGEEEYNDFLNKKNKNISGATSSSNNNTMKTNQYTGSSLHLPSNNQMKTNSELKELKKNIGIEINNEINNYNKIVKDLDSIIDQAHFPSSLKSNRSNFFDSNLNLKTEPRNKIFSPKKIQTPTYLSKNTSKMLSPLKLKTPNINFDLNIANSLLFSPNQLLSPEYLPVLDQSKSSIKKNGIVKSYAANTHQGLVRNYNEDRVAIILNIMKPPNKKDVEWPLCSYFAIYDGHGGTKCAEFLRDNLHHYV